MSKKSSTAYSRNPEVTRTVRLATLEGSCDGCSSTLHHKQTVRWDGPTEDLLGLTAANIPATEEWWLQSIHPEDVQRILDSLTTFLLPCPDSPVSASSRIWGSDYRLRHADGHFVLVADRTIATRTPDGHAVSFRSVIFDKTKHREKRRVYEKRLEAQNHLALIADNTPSGIFMMDPQGYTTYMNAAGTSHYADRMSMLIISQRNKSRDLSFTRSTTTHFMRRCTAVDRTATIILCTNAPFTEHSS